MRCIDTALLLLIFYYQIIFLIILVIIYNFYVYKMAHFSSERSRFILTVIMFISVTWMKSTESEIAMLEGWSPISRTKLTTNPTYCWSMLMSLVVLLTLRKHSVSCPIVSMARVPAKGKRKSGRRRLRRTRYGSLSYCPMSIK